MRRQGSGFGGGAGIGRAALVARLALIARRVLVAFALVAVPGAVSAQVEATPVLQGVVTRAEDPLASAMVVLHRVDAMDAGEIDSIRADGEGRFQFRLPTVPDPGGTGEVYFASVRHQGLLYFGTPIANALQLDSTYSIQVWDTLQAPLEGVEIPIEVRYLLVEAIPDGWQITDLTQLRLEGQNTIVPADGGLTWSYPLPSGGIQNVQVGGGDIAPAAVQLDDETVRLTMPLSPGNRQLMLRYVVDSLNLDLSLPGAVEEFELLVLEPAPTLTVTGLVAVDPVESSPGVVYRRYAASLMADSTLSVRQLPAPAEMPVKLIAFALAFLLAGAGLWAVNARGGSGQAQGGQTVPVGGPASSAAPASGTGGPAPAVVRERIVLAIAQLDEELAGATGERAATISAERASLMERLRELS